MRYYTLDKLSEASLWRIDRALKQFLRDYDVEDYPINCFDLVKKIQASSIIDLGVEETGQLSGGFEAVASYFPEVEAYLIIMKCANQRRMRFSSGRRQNFSMAHELGHIFLQHLLISKKLKTQEQIAYEDMEADEFAGRLLMPEKMILNSNFSTGTDISAEYLVSDRALYRRLNNLKRLDLYRAKPRPTCTLCGYAKISPIADYCEICGTQLSKAARRGVKVIDYPATLTDDNQRVLLCPLCGNEEISSHASFCRICGSPLYNTCDSEHSYNDCNHVNAPNARYCELCGRSTIFDNRGLLRNWKEERAAFIKALTHK